MIESIFFGNIFAFLSYLSFSLVACFYVGYLFVLLHFYRKHVIGAPKKTFKMEGNGPTSQADEGMNPLVSVIVPIHNEEKIIGKKIQNIEEILYPSERIEVIFVDGCSTDRTQELILDRVKECKKSYMLIKQEKRDGYTNAVIRGIHASKGELIVLMDAASYYYPDALKSLTKHFTDSRIGSVTGKEIVAGKTGSVGPQMEESYRRFYDFMRKAETEMDSTPDSKGEILAIRRNICLALIPLLKRSPNASFDSCVPYQAKLMGYKSIYDEQAKYYELAPASFNDRMTVQTRRATLLIAPMFLFKNMLLNKKFGKFSVLIMPAHFTMDCILPAVFWFGCVSLVLASLLSPVAVVPIWALAVVVMLVSDKTRSTLLSFIQSQIALFVALFRLARRKKTLFIESVQSTRS
jgi:glycosyltransferase involved in cell wall biosynthesis